MSSAIGLEKKTILSPKLLAIEAANMLGTSVQNIHKRLKESNLKSSKSQNRVYFDHNTSKALLKLNFTPKIYSLQLVKGGVGKTVVSLNFAVRSALLGAKTLLIELDQQANLTRTLKVNASNSPVLIDIVKDNLAIEQNLIPIIDGLSFLPSRVDNALLDNVLLLEKHPLDKVFATQLTKLKQHFDVIIIDCPPSIGASVSAAALASDVVVMPVIPSDYAMAGLQLTYKELNSLFHKYEKKAEFKVLLNQYDARTSISFNVLSNLIKDEIFGPLMINSYIRKAQNIENQISNGKSVFDSVKNYPEKEDFSTVTQELLGIL